MFNFLPPGAMAWIGMDGVVGSSPTWMDEAGTPVLDFVDIVRVEVRL